MPELKARKVSRSVQVQVGAERALQAFLESGQVQEWWGASQALIEARKGGVWTLAWTGPGQGYNYVVSGVVKSLLPGRRARIEPLVYFNPERAPLGPMRLTILVREKDGRTRVSVRQEGFREGPDWDWYFEAVAGSWKEALGNLKRFLEGAAS
ncbi:MAG TPA: SRPBCC domain-containing protein [Candidatus Acidoferrales bacterium]|nr:SRPBCC domain-containing protein [Candidatus Acidoferrales bacterium]